MSFTDKNALVESLSSSSSAQIRQWHPTTPRETYPFRLFIVKLYRKLPRRIAQHLEICCKKNFTILSLCLGQVVYPEQLLSEIQLLIDLLLRRIRHVQESRFKCKNQCLMKETCPHIQLLMWPVLKMLIDFFHVSQRLQRRSR